MSADVKKKPEKVLLAAGVIRKKPAPVATREATPKPSSAKEKIVRALKKLHPME